MTHDITSGKKNPNCNKKIIKGFEINPKYNRKINFY